MPHNKHQWTRFWIPFDSDVSLDSDDFPYDPEGEFAHYYSLAAQQLSNFQNIPVLILLGEPGIGKSTALEDECERLKKNAGSSVFFRKLNSYDTDTALIDDIFRNPHVQEWRLNPETQLILLLDSLDECRLSIPRAARIIAQQLESLPREWLQLRISCRVADWPEEMSADLERLWPSPQGSESPNVKCLSLMPLRSKDVVTAANDRKLDASAFLEEIFRVNIQPFASHPHTLNMLLDIFQKRGCLPPHRAEIFEQGCLYLVTENSRSRKNDGHVGDLEPSLRLRLAGRIAAQMLLSQKSMILLQDADQPEYSLAISEILGGEEDSDGLKLSVNSRAVREVLDTTLFTGRGEQRLGFVHQSHMEFLTAWYLKKRGLDAERLLCLLCIAEDGHIPPQLGELAAWLVEMDGALFDALMNSDPLILLRSDGSALTDMQKFRLVERLLDAITRHEVSDWGWNLRKHYPKLAHPELAAQLKPLLLDQNLFAPAREAAIEIAAACHPSELGDSLIDMALDSQENQRIRHEAAKAAIETADKVSLGKLRPLLVGEHEDVSFRPLLARALWPEHVSTQEIFGFIAQSKNLGVLGDGRYYLEKWVELFSPSDMQVALGWVKETEHSSAHYDFQKLMDALMVHAWKMFQSEPSIGEAFAQAVWACLPG